MYGVTAKKEALQVIHEALQVIYEAGLAFAGDLQRGQIRKPALSFCRHHVHVYAIILNSFITASFTNFTHISTMTTSVHTQNNTPHTVCDAILTKGEKYQCTIKVHEGYELYECKYIGHFKLVNFLISRYDDVRASIYIRNYAISSEKNFLIIEVPIGLRTGEIKTLTDCDNVRRVEATFTINHED